MSHLPLWAQHEFVRFEVAKEVAATYYRTGISVDLSFRHYESDMLLKDYFRLGITPADHLHEISLKINKYTSMDQLNADYDISDYFTLPNKEWEAKWTEGIAEDLRDLDSNSKSHYSSDSDSDSSD